METLPLTLIFSSASSKTHHQTLSLQVRQLARSPEQLQHGRSFLLTCPPATDVDLGAVSVPTTSGLTVTNGQLAHDSTVFGQNLGFIEYNDTGHILNARAIDASIDIPPATTGSLGVVQIGSGLDVDFTGLLSLSPATTFSLGGVIVGSDFAVDFAGTISLIGDWCHPR